MTQNPTVVIDNGVSFWANEIVKRFPWRWSVDTARTPNGNLYALFYAIATILELNNQQMVQAWQCCRIATAVGTQLDVIAQDFYGVNGLPRLQNETDSQYALRIQTGLFQPLITKPAMTNLIAKATDEIPRMIDPWIAGQTSGFDWSGWDTDTSTSPSLYGDPGARYQGFIIAGINQSNPTYPIYGFDFGAAWDSYLGWFVESEQTESSLEAALDALINRIGAFGMTFWRKYIFESLLPQIIALAYTPATGKTSFSPNIALTVSYTPIASTSWLAISSISNVLQTSFTITTSAPSPSANMLNYAAIPFNVPGGGTQLVEEGVFSQTIDIPADALGARLMINPSWQSNVWIESESETTVTVAFPSSSPPPANAALYFYFFPDAQSGLVPITTGATSQNIPVVVSVAACPFVLPSWQTNIGCQFINGPIGIAQPPNQQTVFTVNTPLAAGSRVVVGGSWASAYAVNEITTNGFNVVCSAAPPNTGAYIYYMVIPPNSSSGGSQTVAASATSATILAPAGISSSDTVIVTPSWPTTVWISSISSGQVVVNFGTAAPDANQSISYYFFDVDQTATVSIGLTTVGVSVTTFGNVPFITPNWNTTVALTFSSSAISASFGTAAPSNAFIEYAQAPITQYLNVQFATAAPSGGFVHYGYLAVT